jgi:hypothetical protein
MGWHKTIRHSGAGFFCQIPESRDDRYNAHFRRKFVVSYPGFRVPLRGPGMTVGH